MSAVIPEAVGTSSRTEADQAPPPRRRRRAIAFLLVLAIASAAAAVITQALSGGGGSEGTIDNATPTSLATVTRSSLASRTNLNGTLGYGGTFDVVNQATGTLTDLPAVGEVIGLGEVLYRVDGAPIVLLPGRVPVYRTLLPGTRGLDVRQLNAALVDLGYATRTQIDPASDRFIWPTSRALRQLQDDLGLEETGILTLGQAVFLPAAARVTEVSAALGSPATAGTSILSATSTKRRVLIDLDAARQSQVEVGDEVTITLPDGTTTPGVVSRVGTVATTPEDQQDANPTIPVEVTPTRPAATGTLDQAPVLVSITTASEEDVLVVPVDALLALAGGGYAVEVDENGARHLVPVELGLFDEAEGLVQVSGVGLEEGQRVVVPAS